MFPLDEICLRCSLFVVLCTTTLAAPGGLGSLAESSAVAFSNANSNAQAGSLASAVSSAHAISSAHAVSSANAFAGGLPHDGSIPSSNKDDTNHGSIQHPGIFAGTGSFVGYGSNKADSEKIGLTHHQASGNTGNSKDNKSPVPCAPCQNKEDKWEKGGQLDYDEQNEEKESEQEKESKDSYDDGQYRPEYHYYEDANDKKEEQTASEIHKIEDDHSDDTEINNDDDESYYNSMKDDGKFGSKIHKNVESTPSQAQHSSHLTYVNKQTGNGHANAAVPGSVAAPHLSTYSKDAGTNAGTFGVATGGNTNLDLTSGINAGCSNTKPGSNCGASGTGLDQGPIKLDQSDIIQTPKVPALETEQNKGPAGCDNNYGNCGNVKLGGVGQYPSVSGNKENVPNIGNIGTQHKPQLPAQQNTGQWAGHANKDTLTTGNTGQWAGHANKDTLTTGNTGQWAGHANKDTLTTGNTGQWTSEGNKPSLDQQSTGQWPGIGSKPSSLDQQNTGQWTGHANKETLLTGNTGQWAGTANKPSLDQQSTGHFEHHDSTHGPGCTSGESSVPYPGEASTLQKILPIPTQTYSGVGSGDSYSDDKNTATKDIIYGAPSHGGTYYPESHKDSFGPVGISTPSTGPPGHIGSSFPHGLGTTGFPQNGVGIKQPIGSGNCGTFGVSPCTSGTGYPESTGITGVQVGQNVQGQTHTDNVGSGYVDKNIYQINTENPFLHNVQGNIEPLIHTTSSPVQVPSYTGTVETTDKPIGLGNPFLDGTLQISNTYDTHHVNTDQSNYDKVVTTTETLNEPIGVGNPFLTHGHEYEHGNEHGIGNVNGHGSGHQIGHEIGHESGHGSEHGHGHGHGHVHGHVHGHGLVHNKGDSPIYNIGITIGGTQPTSTLPSVTTTVKPIGIDNPFFQQTGGNGIDKQYSVGCSDNKPGSNCETSGTGLDQRPIKLDQSDIVQTPNVPALETEQNKVPAGCSNNFYGNCGNVKPGGVGQYPSVSGNKENLPNIGNIGTQHKPQLPEKQNTGQWAGHANKDTLTTGNTGQWAGHANKDTLTTGNTGQWTGAGNKPSLDQQSTGQWPGAGNKPSSLDQQSTGQLTVGGNNEHSSGNQGHKNTIIGSGTTYPASPIQPSPIDKDALHFPKTGNAGIGLPSSEIHRNINQGVKGGAHHNKEFGSIANSNAGVSATGNVNTPNIPGAHNGYNNVGIHGGSNVPGYSGYIATPQTSGNGDSANNNQHIPQVANGAALSLATANAGANVGPNVDGPAGAHAGSYSSSFSSSQASSSSFAASQSASYAASGDLPGIMPQIKGPWPFDIGRNINLNSTWANATSQASSFAANSSGKWSGLHPVGVQSR